MNKTAMVQIALMAFVFWGLWNVVKTELSGHGLISMLDQPSDPDQVLCPNEIAMLASASVIQERAKAKHPTVTVEFTVNPHPGKRVFRCFTASARGWEESTLGKH